VTKNLIVLTAAVEANPIYGSALSDPATRLKQYVASVSGWARIAEKCSFDLLVVETSGNEEALAKYFPTCGFRVEDEIAKRGKGAAEAVALDDALVNYQLSKESTVVKVTGRLQVRNATRLIIPSAGDVRVRRTLDRRYCDTRFFISSYAVWESTLTGMHHEVDDSNGRYLEHVMAKRLIDAEYTGVEVARFAERPQIIGSSGTTNQKYGSWDQRFRGALMRGFEEVAMKKLVRKQI
jgi:hypothetical protein